MTPPMSSPLCHTTPTSTITSATASSTTALAGSASINMMHDAASSFLVATIDADIANISDDKFGLIFAGGMAVMAGGVLSAVIVGAILEKGDLYASVVADSYLQGAEDEEFWKGLSEEEKKKAQELLQKVKASKEGGGKSNSSNGAEVVQPVTVMAAAAAPPSSVVVDQNGKPDPQESPVPVQKEEKKETDMFSDY